MRTTRFLSFVLSSVVLGAVSSCGLFEPYDPGKPGNGGDPGDRDTVITRDTTGHNGGPGNGGPGNGGPGNGGPGNGGPGNGGPGNGGPGNGGPGNGGPGNGGPGRGGPDDRDTSGRGGHGGPGHGGPGNGGPGNGGPGNGGPGNGGPGTGGPDRDTLGRGGNGGITRDSLVSDVGVIVANRFEGGFYGIVGDHCAKIDPVNLAAEFKESGLRVRFTARLLNQPSVHQWGTPAEVISMSRVR